MSPQQIANIVRELHEATGQPIEQLIAHYAAVYALTDASIERVRELVGYAHIEPGHCAYDRISALNDRGVETCDAVDHNEPGGCSNPKCWKYGRST